MVQKQELIQSYHFPITSKHLDRHATYDRPPSIRDELARGNLEVRKKLHNEWMNGKTKAAQKGSFIEAYFSVGEITSLFIRTGQAKGGTFGKLKSLSKPLQVLFFQGTKFREGMQRS